MFIAVSIDPIHSSIFLELETLYKNQPTTKSECIDHGPWANSCMKTIVHSRWFRNQSTNNRTCRAKAKGRTGQRSHTKVGHLTRGTRACDHCENENSNRSGRIDLHCHPSGPRIRCRGIHRGVSGTNVIYVVLASNGLGYHGIDSANRFQKSGKVSGPKTHELEEG